MKAGGLIESKIKKLGKINSHGIITNPAVNDVRRGDIVIVELRGAKGSEQKGIRPAVIISNDINNRLSSTVTIVPVTTADKNPWQGTHADLGELKCLDVRSMALCEQITTVDKSCLLKKIGTLEDWCMWRVEHAVRVQLYGTSEVISLICS